MTDSLFEHYKAALRRGHLAALAGHLDEALEAYREAGRLVPERSLPLASQGTVLHRLGRWDEATAAFDGALALSPDDEAALRARATARDERGLRPDAAADFERLAFVLDVAGRAREAADVARRAADLEPTEARHALADRLTAAAQAPALVPGGVTARAATVPEPGVPTTDAAADAGAQSPGAAASPGNEDDPEAAAAWAAVAERFAVERLDEAAGTDRNAARHPAPRADEDAGLDDGAALDEDAPLAHAAPDSAGSERAGNGAEAHGLGTAATPTVADGEAASFPGLDQEPAVEPPEAPAAAAAAVAGTEGDEDRHEWPPVDLPTIPPGPLEGPAPDPEQLLALATAAVEARDLPGARDLLLTAVIVHREAGRLDAALEVCLELLEIAPGDPQVHIAIANLQLDRGWVDVAKEKIDLLLRLTSLTGDTQSEADVHYLASERLRDDPVTAPAAR